MSRYQCAKLRTALTVVGLLHCQQALAQDTNAEVLFHQGRVALAEGNYAVACDKLRQSDELDPAPGTKLNLGECEALRGHVATAYRLFVAVEQQLSAADVRLPIAKTKREAMESRLPKLRITLAPNAPRDSEIRVNEQMLASSAYGTDTLLDPGVVVVTVTAAGFAENRVRVVLEEGKTQNFEAMPLPLAIREQDGATLARGPVVTPHRDVPMDTARAATSTQTPPSTKGVVALGLGISITALASVAGILTLKARSDNQAHCNEVTQSCDADGRDAASRGRILGALTTGGLVAGALGIGLGTYWIVKSDGEPRRAAMLTLRSDGAMSAVELRGRF